MVQLRNYDLMLLTETKIPNVVYCHNHLGYNILCSRVLVTAAGGGARGSGTGHEVASGGMDCLIHALPRAELGDL